MRREAVILILAAGVGLTIVAALAMGLEARRLRKQTEDEAVRRIDLVQRHVQNVLDECGRAVSLAAGEYVSGSVKTDEDHARATDRILQLCPPLTTLSYIDATYILRRIHPIRGFEVVIGQDVARDELRQAAIRRTVESGKPAISGPLRLASGGLGLIIYQALPDGGLVNGMVPMRRLGEELVAPVLGAATAFTLEAEGFDVFFKHGDLPEPEFRRSTPITVGERTWTLTMDSRALAADLVGGVTVWPLVGAMGMLTLLLVGLGLLYLTRLREIERLYTEIRGAAVERRQMTEFLVHDLKNPINAITGYLDLLSSTAADPAALGYVDNARMAARELLKMVRNILDVARLREGKLVPEKQPLSLGSLLEAKAREYRGLAESAGIDLRIDGDGAVPPAIGDPELTERMLENLLSNALRFTPRGGTVTLAARPEGAFVACAVSDTGPGIPEEHRERLFKRFEPITPPHVKRGAASTGLGLAFCRLAVEAQGGRIRHETPAAGGTRIVFILPTA